MVSVLIEHERAAGVFLQQRGFAAAAVADDEFTQRDGTVDVDGLVAGDVDVLEATLPTPLGTVAGFQLAAVVQARPVLAAVGTHVAPAGRCDGHIHRRIGGDERRLAGHKPDLRLRIGSADGGDRVAAIGEGRSLRPDKASSCRRRCPEATPKRPLKERPMAASV